MLLFRNLRRKSIYLSFFLGFALLGIYISFEPTFSSNFQNLQTDPGDTRIVHYFMEHSYRFIFSESYQFELWSPGFYYPFRNALALSENLLGAAPFYWALRFFLEPSLSYQFWLCFIFLLNYLSMFSLLRYFNIRNIFVLIMFSYLFAFNLPRLIQIGHQHLMPQFYTPLSFLFLFRFFDYDKIRYFYAFLIFAYLQFLASIYLGWFLLLALFIMIPLLFISRKYRLVFMRNLFSKKLAYILLSIGCFGIMMFLTFKPYLEINKLVGGRNFFEVEFMLPRLSSYFFFPKEHLFYSGFFNTILNSFDKNHLLAEHYMFPGLFLYVSALLSVGMLCKKNFYLKKEKTLIKIFLLLYFMIFLFSLKVGKFSLWKLIHSNFPGGKGIRAVTRIHLIMNFFLVISSALLLNRIFKNITISYALPLFLLLFSFIILESYYKSPSFPIKPVELRISRLVERIEKYSCQISYLKVENSYIDEIDAMWAGLRTNTRVVNGYSGGVPPYYINALQVSSINKVLSWIFFKAHKNEVNGKNFCYLAKENDSYQLVYSQKIYLK
ncbi:MAG: hypothetical protein H7A25_00030 [Leptospiraceae bacterium]|nr:hypothetical protein [Leptospiraceae bacterium]